MNIGFRYPVAHRGQGFPRPNPIVAVGGGGSEFAFLILTDKQFLAWEDYAISTIAEPE